jgi:hypothetical protein
MFSWSIEHFLIATTMLVVGIFAVLSWTTLFPDHRDVLVLAPLPIRAHTILLAKLAAVATALGLAVFVLHVAAGIVWPAALNTTARARMQYRLSRSIPLSRRSARWDFKACWIAIWRAPSGMVHSPHTPEGVSRLAFTRGACDESSHTGPPRRTRSSVSPL